LSIQNKISSSFNNLRLYCENEKFKGWDPYDGLNSPFFKFNPLIFIRFFRLATIQFFKKFPYNLRTLLLINKGYNPKGLGLFLTSYCNLYKFEKRPEYLEKINFLAKKIIELQTQGYAGACWGYNFDWQSRVFFLKKGTPTIVVTSFVSYSLMDAYDITKNEDYLKTALSSCEFVIQNLNRTTDENGFIFSYSPLDNTSVFNASLLGSRLLARAYSYNKNENYLKIAKQSVNSVVKNQKDDGSWLFGKASMQNWVDSFHTGYKLECISEYQKYSRDLSYNNNIDLGLKYYLENFFLEDGTPKYYDKKVYPIDIHCPAQLIATLHRLSKIEENIFLVEKVLNWTIDNMQDKNGCFYYQIKNNHSIKIPYIRWGQAWMMYGFSFYFLNKHSDSNFNADVNKNISNELVDCIELKSII